MKCPWCGKEVLTEEYSHHLTICSRYIPAKERKKILARVGPVFPPKGWMVIKLSRVDRDAIGNLLERRVKWWTVKVEEELKMWREKVVLLDTAQRDVESFLWAMGEAIDIAEEIGVEKSVLDSMEHQRGLATNYSMQIGR